MYSMLRDARRVLANWIFPVYILCATILITKGPLYCPLLLFFHNLNYLLFVPCFYRCIAENETECPACAREHGVIREIRHNNEKLADQHDVFLSEVQEHGFEAVASAYGRGVLNASRLEESL